ncbi:MAG: hypothetical protein PHC75_01405 [Burkholderiales bacterium]|nr:hypothetical protein [Burkholderiales bacterium]
MKKLLLCLCVTSSLSYAADLDMNNLYCNDYKLNSATTLGDVRAKCNLKNEYDVTYNRYDGMYEVKFINTATKKSVKCDFAESSAASLLNGCR